MHRSSEVFKPSFSSFLVHVNQGHFFSHLTSIFRSICKPFYCCYVSENEYSSFFYGLFS